MRNIVDFLEKLGQDAEWRHASATEIEAAMKRAGIAPDLQTAILNRDQRSIESLLGADTNVCCLVHSPSKEEEDEDEADEDSADEEADKVKSYRRDAGRVA